MGFLDALKKKFGPKETPVTGSREALLDLFVTPKARVHLTLKQRERENGKHVFVRVKDEPIKHPTEENKFKRTPGSLDAKLAKLKKKGAKILGFKRDGNEWTIKCMVPA